MYFKLIPGLFWGKIPKFWKLNDNFNWCSIIAVVTQHWVKSKIYVPGLIPFITRNRRIRNLENIKIAWDTYQMMYMLFQTVNIVQLKPFSWEQYQFINFAFWSACLLMWQLSCCHLVESYLWDPVLERAGQANPVAYHCLLLSHLPSIAWFCRSPV